jgi:2-dehydro-3-deoxyphosphooctonate aldolase (KDO 8-P synthase)
VGDVSIGGGGPFVLIAGPCVIEDRGSALRHAEFLRDLTEKLEIPFIFKSSYDKANRTSLKSYRGPGLELGLKILSEIRRSLGVQVLTDVHQLEEIPQAREVADVLQIPAFLCRQTDFVMAVGRAGKPVNIKKGQFLAPWDMRNVLEKIVACGNRDILVTERGTCFGYNNLVSDLRSLPILAEEGYPVVFDATHSLQFPGGLGHASGGEGRFIPMMARAAVAVRLDGIFMEVHEDPDHALSDGPNSLNLKDLAPLLLELKEIDTLVKRGEKK